MKRAYRISFTIILFIFTFCFWAFAQEVSLTGKVLDKSTKEPAPFANVLIKGTLIGVSTDINGNFELTTEDVSLPFTLLISYTGYADQELEITQNNEFVVINLEPEVVIIGEGVVVSASRQPERILESPVSVERMDSRMIRNTASPSFYDALENLKGVQLNTNSLTFKSVNTRGFATFANVRFVQLIDGMDNAPPGLNFPAGNLVGISELDVQNAELVPGAASALYGPNAFNGILFLNSKSPYLHKGLSAMVRTGITTQDDAVISEDPMLTKNGTNPFGEMAIRYADVFGPDDKVGFKLNFSYLRGTDWFATDYNDMDMHPINTHGIGSPSYNGVNVYGDEIATTINVDAILENIIDTSLGLPAIRVARTGYREIDIVDTKAESMKFDGALHYKFNNTLEGIASYRAGFGSSVYQGSNRYALKDIWLHQAKLELRDDNFFVRWYTTIENAGKSYDTRFAGWNINRAWKSDNQWFTEYTETYIGTLITVCPGAPPGSKEFEECSALAHNNARAVADNGRLLPGTAEFETERDRITALADLKEGSRFIDKTTMQHVEANYNFKDLMDFAELQVGGNWRYFRLNSEGTIFTDSPEQGGPIPINEFGAYVQAAKKFLPDDALKLTASLRLDKSSSFDPVLSPRASAVFTFGENRQHNFRTSFQTGFRNPDTQSQFIGLDLGVATLVGGAESNIADFFIDIPYLGSDGFTETRVLGPDIYTNSFTASSAQAYSAAVQAAIAGGEDELVAAFSNTHLLEVFDRPFIQPEKITSYEIGYKGIINRKLSIDINGYYSKYRDFQTETQVIYPLEGTVDAITPENPFGLLDLKEERTRVFQLYVNADGTVAGYGAGLGLDYSLPKNFIVGAQYTFADLSIDSEADPDIIPGFNTPKHRVNLSFGNTGIGNSNISFMLNWRWLDSYEWQANFGNGPVDAYNVLDAQISYAIPKTNTTIKIGGSNILNKRYSQAFGAAPIGAQYFISLVYDGTK